MDQLDDEQLLAMIKRGDKPAFRELTGRYLNKVWRVAFNILQNKQDAEDVTQEIFITVWNYRDKWVPGAASFSTWLYRVAFNKAIDSKRQRKITCELDDNLNDNGQSADDAVADKQLQEIFMLCLKTIPEKQMVCLLLFYYEELNVEEICVKLKTTEDSVRSLLKRGRVSLKEALRDRLGNEYWKIQGVAAYLRK
jgi:RNA polymerase sigma-70 factor (ECF subfamily)